MKLAESRAERDLQDSLAEVFSIITTLDEIEKAYLKDAIQESDYTEICGRLLNQYKSILTDEAVAKEFGDLEAFKREWDVRYPCAKFERAQADLNRWRSPARQSEYESDYLVP